MREPEDNFSQLSEQKKTDRSGDTSALPGTIWLIMAFAAFALVYINPFRETEVDDDWAYALTVRHLLDTGQYRLHDSATANMPFQAYWGALFARFGGYFHGNLRLSTLVLWALALVAFYFLCREHGLDRPPASLLVLGLICSPLALMMSFRFMTDIPYLSCLIVALYLYTRSLRLRRYDVMFVASVAASAAILTRQFGAVLIGAMALLWAISEGRRRNLALFAMGLTLPLIALGWQLHMGLAESTGGTRMISYQLGRFYSQPIVGLSKILSWRTAAIFHYIAFFALPFALLPASEVFCTNHDRLPGTRPWLPAALIAGCMVGILIYSHLFSVLPSAMPLLGVNFDSLRTLGYPLRLLLTVLTTLGGSLAAFSFLSRYRVDWPQLSAPERLLDFVTAGVVLSSLTYSNFVDRYLLPFLPYVLIVLGRKYSPLLRQHARSVAGFCLLIALITVVYTRADLARNEALWKGGDLALHSASPRQTVSASREWDGYYYFAAFLAQKRATLDFNKYDDVYEDWLRQEVARSDFRVADQPPENSSWTVMATVSYRSFPFVERRVYVLKRPR